MGRWIVTLGGWQCSDARVWNRCFAGSLKQCPVKELRYAERKQEPPTVTMVTVKDLREAGT
jgi:hypothetical protein